jgi:Na+/melibiose symporter-like transporter
MISLTEQQKMFLNKRAKMVRTWPRLGAFLIVVELGLAGWLFWKHPLLINPQAVSSKLRAGSIPDSTLSLMAAFLPFIMLVCLALLAFLILFSFLALSNEKKHLDIIRDLQDKRRSI